MRPMAGGSAAEATREEVPGSTSDLKVINQTLRGEGRCISMVRRPGEIEESTQDCCS